MPVRSLCHLAAQVVFATHKNIDSDVLGIPQCVLERDDVREVLAHRKLGGCVAEFKWRTKPMYAVIDSPRPTICILDAIRRMCVDWHHTSFAIDFDTESVCVQLALMENSRCISLLLGTVFLRNDGSFLLLSRCMTHTLGPPPESAFKKWY